jgi:hypothetical protein
MASEERVKKQDVIFFFGAGASVDAGIPDTYKFVADFETYIKEHHINLYETLKEIIETRQRFNQEILVLKTWQVDVEQLMDTLSRLIDREKDPLVYFYEEKKFRIDPGQGSFAQLKTLLEKFIRKTMIIEEELKIAYLKDLLQFETPIEVYSTNYDTCIERLSYSKHRRYTDGFDINWNKKNFDEPFDVKHYKLHGSAIWYQNTKTKECMKVSVYTSSEGALRSIYGEPIEPLLIYPAQKSEYVEPLTDLQLMFKERIFSAKTKFLVVVGYSFRDEYIIRMLWDAARINEDLQVIIISPNAHQIFQEKLKFINKDRYDESRIADRIICLPYPFATVIKQLKNHYLKVLRQVNSTENNFAQQERDGQSAIPWQYLVRLCIDAEFSTKTEFILEEKIGKQWRELHPGFGSQEDLAIYAIKGLLHSVTAHDGLEEKWLSRVNDSFQPIGTDNLRLPAANSQSFLLEFMIGNVHYSLDAIADRWVIPILTEETNKLNMLTKKFADSLKTTEESFKRLEDLRSYLDAFKGYVEWKKYYQSQKRNFPEIEKLWSTSQIAPDTIEETARFVLGVEKTELEKIYGGKTFQFKLQKL